MAVSLLPFEGRFRRLIDIQHWDAKTVVGWLEDDFHHFGLTIIHDGQVVKDVQGNAVRYPWTSCPGAFEPLRALIGQPLLARCSDVGKLVNMRLQCTHLFDLAGLLLSHAFHGREQCTYQGLVEKVGGEGEDLRRATLSQDGRLVMTWDMRGGDAIIGPAPYGGHSTDRGFREWTEAMEATEAEWASVLRRTVFVAHGRVFGIRPGKAAEMGLPAVCHTYQPEVACEAERITGHVIRHDDKAEDMLALRRSKP